MKAAIVSNIFVRQAITPRTKYARSTRHLSGTYRFGRVPDDTIPVRSRSRSFSALQLCLGTCRLAHVDLL